MSFKPFNYGNAIAQAEGIKGQRLNNLLTRGRLNALQNPQPDQPELGLNPFFTQDGQGNIRAYQLSKTGGLHELPIPEGMQAAIPTRNVDTGTTILTQDRFGNIRGDGFAQDVTKPSAEPPVSGLSNVSGIPKQIPPEQTPEHKAAIARAQTEATNQANLVGQPAIEAAKEEAVSEVKNKWGGIIAKNIELAKAKSKEEGATFNELQQMKASLPGLQASINQLKKLSHAATYTKKGQAWDAIVRESGFGATEGSTARAEFIAIVDNQVLPLLRQTFGAAFTKAEGDWLRATMGDPNASPEEKNAQLDAFIVQKVRNIESKQLQLGGEQPPDEYQKLLKELYPDG